MPELPEVETVAQGLRQKIIGEYIEKIYFSDKNLRFPYSECHNNEHQNTIAEKEFFSKNVVGKKIIEINRRAKYILIKLDDDNHILLHLGMSGRVIVQNQKFGNFAKHDHFAIGCASGKIILFNDTRRFGCVSYVKDKEIALHKLLKNLGFEPFDKNFNGKYLKNLFRGKKQNIKNSIMNQSIVAGMGNIYASEALFESRINPCSPSHKISNVDSEKLANAIRNVMKEAIKSGGSTLRDYKNADGEEGYFQHQFKVYGREGRQCSICKNLIKKIRQSGRSSFYCENCQKLIIQ